MKKYVFLLCLITAITGCQSNQDSSLKNYPAMLAKDMNLVEIEKKRILPKAKIYINQQPITLTANKAERSAGGLHDFYSEGDYWWPDPQNLSGPYIRRDGETNPNNFVAHRQAMLRFSEVVSTMTSAYLLTHNKQYAEHAIKHLRAWFVEEQTKMNPHLLYGQAIKGLYTGRSIGIIDTLHLVEVALSVKKLSRYNHFSQQDQITIKKWFSAYLTWMNTHAYGLEEKIHPNNHGVSWSLQAAVFANLTGNQEIPAWIRTQFKTVYIPQMMNSEGGFTDELTRTKAYGYSLFMIDIMAGVAQFASTPDDDLWLFELPDGRGMKQAMRFIAPYIKNKKTWPKAPDIQYWDNWPVRHPSLLMGGMHFNNADYLGLWRSLEADPTTFEVLRNLPLRHPLLWM